MKISHILAHAFVAVTALVSTPSVADVEIRFWPPERYMTGEFLAPVIVYNLSPAEVSALCRTYAIPDSKTGEKDASNSIACAIFRGEEGDGWAYRFGAYSCNIFIVDPVLYQDEGYFVGDQKYADVLVHEEGHCRGWSPDHED